MKFENKTTLVNQILKVKKEKSILTNKAFKIAEQIDKLNNTSYPSDKCGNNYNVSTFVADFGNNIHRLECSEDGCTVKLTLDKLDSKSLAELNEYEQVTSVVPVKSKVIVTLVD